MKTLKANTDKKIQALDTAALIDCGRASEQTQGLMFLIFNELGLPPVNLFFGISL